MNSKLKIIPIGGLGEIGMNMMVVQYGRAAIVIDCGVMFSNSYFPGIDLILPNFEYVLDDSIDFLAVILTHGHEDHIGALPFLLRQRNIPVYGSKFTLELVQEKLREQHLLKDAELNLVSEGKNIKLDPFGIEFIQMSHSIADALGLAIQTPAGLIVHTGDFKIDPHPADGRTTDLKRFEELGQQGVLLLFSDSTNVEIPGSSVSENSVRDGLEEIMEQTPGWFILSSFASHLPRIRQIFEIAQSQRRKVHVVGRTMIQNVGIGQKLGYLTCPKGFLVDADEVKTLPRHNLAILSTGSQGEPRSALARMAFDQHKALKVQRGDHVVLSSRFIPGNERAIYEIVNHLYRRGAEVFTTKGADVHVSGHAYRGDLEKMLSVVKPKYFVPVHGEYRHLVKHIQLAQELGIPSEQTILLEDGQPIEFANGKVKRLNPLDVSRSVVDGKDFADIGTTLLRDRRQLAETGLVVAVVMLDSHSGELVRDPELFAKGLAFEEHVEDLLDDAQSALCNRIEDLNLEMRTDTFEVQEEVRLAVRRFFRNRLDRKPVVIPIVIEV